MPESEKNGESLKITPAGKMEIRPNSDGSVTVSSSEGVTLNDMRIKAVSIANIIDVKSYGVKTTEGRTMHLIEFRDGGRFELTYNSLGKIENCFGEGVRTQVLDTRTLVIHQLSTIGD